LLLVGVLVLRAQMIHVHADRLTDVVNAVAMRIKLGSHTCSLRLIPVRS
jgi:hypothetical protein